MYALREKLRKVLVRSSVYKKKKAILITHKSKDLLLNAFIPSVGQSGGIIVIWNSSVFEGTVIEQQSFSVRISMASKHSADIWTLITVYGPCDEPTRDDFVTCLNALQIPHENWLLVGDVNFYRSLENKN